MINYKEKYREEKIFTLIVMIISILAVIFLSLNIKIRNEEIWKLETENVDLKEQIHILEIRQQNYEFNKKEEQVWKKILQTG